MDFDQVLEQVGGFGRFQCLNYALLLLPTAHTAIFMMTYIFAARDIPYRCYVPECDDAPGPPGRVLDAPWLAWALPPSPVARPWPTPRPGASPAAPPHSCLRFAPRQGPAAGPGDAACSSGDFDANRTLRCDRWVFPEHERTVVSEFNITCEENRWRLTSVGSLNFLGQLLGMPFSGMFSDRFGRRSMLRVAVPLSWLCGTARSFTTSFNAYVILELLDSFVSAGIYSACFLLGLELVTGRHRVVGNSVVSSFYSLGCVFLGAVSWLQPDWRWMVRMSYLPAGASVAAVWLLPESVRWLLSRGLVDEAQATLRKVAAVNGVILAAPLHLLDAERADSLRDKTSSSSSSSCAVRPPAEGGCRSALAALRGWPVVQVCRSSLLLRRLCICASLWVVNAFVYFGLALRSVALAGDLHLNFILAALVEMPSYLLAWRGSERWGRRASLSSSLALTGAALLAFLVLPAGMMTLQLALYLTGKLAITASFTVLYVFTAELFPTSARHSVVGLCSSIGRMGSTLAPQTPLLEVFFWGMPILVFGLMCVGGALLALLLPETLGQPLPDNLSQAKAMGAARPAESAS